MEEGRRGHEYSRAVLWNSKLYFDDDKEINKQRRQIS